MSDSYQAIYDAVRSRIGGCNVGDIIREVARNAFDFSWAVAPVVQDFGMAALQMQKPSVLYRPSIAKDGNKWCTLYGENLMQGVAGFGDSPAEAMEDFDRNWTAREKGA
jgi:hypothetical protein